MNFVSFVCFNGFGCGLCDFFYRVGFVFLWFVWICLVVCVLVVLLGVRGVLFFLVYICVINCGGPVWADL